ncbi:MAG: choice-of-anchor J domain-containing protein, partial [Bacteroidales bacterium]|nr:choice-of-anchor J domain-containing protein [Bacteroidales bacterium]
ISLTSTGATSKTVTCNGSVVASAAATTLPYSEPFVSGLGDCYTYSVSGATREWGHNSSTSAAKMNGFGSSVTEEDWLILPGIDLDYYSDEILTFESWKRYGSDDANNYFKLYYSTNYSGTGTPSGSSWTELSFTQPSTEQVWTSSGNVDLSGISGTSVWIAFKYHYESGSYRWWEIDDISIQEVSVADPVSFSSAASSISQIDLSATENGNSDNIMVAYNSTNTFGTPSGSYSAGNSITGGGTVHYVGTAASLTNHTGLSANQTVYYKAWSVDGSNNYSDGLTDDATTFANEPTNHVTGFSATANSWSEITVNWTDSDADYYLIKGSDVSYAAIVAPVDGTAETNGTLVQNVGANPPTGINSLQFTGLSGSTTYYFKIYPYNGTGATVNYKTNGTVPSDNATTWSTPLLILSEMCDPLSNFATDRYIQIYNAGISSIDLSTWSVVAVGNATDIYTWTLSGSMKPGEVKTCGDDGNTIFTPDFAPTNWSTSNSTWNGKVDDGAKLLNGTTIIDNASTHGNFENKVAVRNNTVTQPTTTFTAAEWTSTSVTNAGDPPSIPANHYCNAPEFTIGPGNWTTLTTNYGIGASYNISGAVNVDNAPATPAQCYNCDVLSDATLTINAGKALTVNGTMSVASSKSTKAAGTLTIKSDVNGTGSLIEKTGVSATVERYLTEQKWHYVSAPVDNPNTSVFLNLYMMWWDEPNEKWWNVLSGDSTLSIDMQGYSVWSSSGTTGNTTVTFSGVLNTGSKTIAVTNNNNVSSDNSGYNFVGNPYASGVDWDVNDGSGWTRTNVANSIYIWNQGVGNYGVYVKGNSGSGTNNVTNEIPPHQGFFVYCNDDAGPGAGSGSLSIDNGARIHSSQEILKGGKAINENIKFAVSGNNYKDEIIISINQDASYNFDSEFDAKKLNGSENAPQLYTLASDGNELSINSIPSVETNLTIPLNIEVSEDTFYELSMTELEGFETLPIYLEDMKENKVVDIKSVINYKFFASANDEAQRFLLHFSHNEAPVISEGQSGENILIYASKKIITIQSANEMNGAVKVFDLLGKEVFSGRLNNTIAHEINMIDKEGYFIVNIVSDNSVTNKKIYLK